MLPKLVVWLVMEALAGRLLDRPVHPFDLAVRPWMTRFGETVFDFEVGAGCFEGMAAIGQFLCPHRFDFFGRPAIARGFDEVRPIVGKHRVYPGLYGRGEVAQEVASDAPCLLLVQFHERELVGSVDRHQQVKLALFGPYLGEIDVEVGDRVHLELLPRRLVSVDLGQAADAVALQAAVKGRSRQMRDGRL
jgi:hypothetical protein